MFRKLNYDAIWIAQKTNIVRRVYQLTLVVILAVGYFLREKLAIDNNYLLIGFFATLIVGMVIVHFVEKSVRKNTRENKANTYITDNPTLSPEIKNGLLDGNIVVGMSDDEIEITTGKQVWRENNSDGEDVLYVNGAPYTSKEQEQ